MAAGSDSPPASFDPTLIFDLGLHDGSDSRFYLDKGFRVVAVEANPGLAAAAARRFAAEISADRLTILQRAVAEAGDREVPFFISDESDGWSSLYRGSPERFGGASREISVRTTSLAELFDSHGVPYYLKCDLEGADEIVARQLLQDRRRPGFISVEITDPDLVRLLRQAGYDRFQLVNQGRHRQTRAPAPAREGRYVDVRFDGRMSGLFGRELNPALWCDYETCLARFGVWLSVRRRPRLVRWAMKRWGKVAGRLWLVDGWMDVHATTAAMLAREP